MDTSVVVPVYNEEDNVDELVSQIHGALSGGGRSFEIILVDDGSSDETRDRIVAATQKYPELRHLFLARNYGQSTAMQAGLDAAEGDVIVTMDGDLQNDPADIPRLIEILETENVDLVSGWRRDRHDGSVRVFLSRVANRLISRVTGVSLHDYGCSLKAYRGDVVRQIKITGELHRFIPALMAEVGASFHEVVVNHRPRIHGSSKYGLDRTLRVGLDLLLIVFMRRYIQRPLHFFGSIGAFLGILGFAICAYLVVLKIVFDEAIGGRPLLLLGVLLVVSAVTMVVQGLIGELLVRLLHQSDDRPQYRLRLARKVASNRPFDPQLAEKETVKVRPVAGTDSDRARHMSLQRKIFSVVLAIVLTAAILYFLLEKSETDVVLDLFYTSDPAYVLLAILLGPIVQYLRAWRFQRFFFGKVARPDFSMVQIATYLNFFNFLIPFRLGELSFPLMMKRTHAIDYTRSAAVLVLVRLTDLAVVVGLAGLALITLSAIEFRSVGALLVLGFVVFLAVVLALPDDMGARLLHRLGVKNRKLSYWIDAFSSGLTSVSRNKDRTGFVAISLAIWIVQFAICFLTLRAVTDAGTFIHAVVAGAAAIFSFTLPINGVAGLGPVQLAWTYGLQVMGMEYNVGVSSSILFGGITVVSISIQALGIFLLSLARNRLKLSGSYENQ